MVGERRAGVGVFLIATPPHGAAQNGGSIRKSVMQSLRGVVVASFYIKPTASHAGLESESQHSTPYCRFGCSAAVVHLSGASFFTLARLFRHLEPFIFHRERVFPSLSSISQFPAYSAIPDLVCLPCRFPASCEAIVGGNAFVVTAYLI